MRQLLFLAAAVFVVAQPLVAAEAPHDVAPMMADPGLSQRVAQADRQSSLSAFKQRYVKAGRPRMAIYFNRELSDEVEEWKTPVRIETAVRNNRGEVIQAETAIHYRADHENRRGSDTSSDMAWAFEDGFYNAFARQGARLVDRRMMLRLAAAKRPENAKGMVARQHIEMSAFKDHADLLVELLVQRNPSSPSGYNFRAQATNVKTAQVVAMVNASEINPLEGKFVAGHNGYERARMSGTPDEVKQVGQQVAEELMRALAVQI